MSRNTMAHASSATQTTFLQTLENFDIRHMITSQSETTDFLALCNTNSKLRKDLRAERWDFEGFLSRWVDSPRRFRRLQAETGAVVMGLQALAFVEGLFFRDVPHLPNASERSRFALQVGISEDSREERESYLSDERFEAKLRRPHRVKQSKPSIEITHDVILARHHAQYGDFTIQLQSCKTLALGAVFSAARCSSELCFITSHRVYSLYTRATLLQHHMYLLAKVTPMVYKTLDKLEKIGWGIDTMIIPKISSYPYSRHELDEGPRHVGDRHCFSYTLKNSQIPVNLFSQRYELSEFLVTKSPIGDLLARFEIQIEPQSHPMLKQVYLTYISSHGSDSCSVWINTVGSRLTPLLAFIMMRFPKETWNPCLLGDIGPGGSTYWIKDTQSPHWDGWTPPLGWRYFDDMFAKLMTEAFLEREAGPQSRARN